MTLQLTSEEDVFLRHLRGLPGDQQVLQDISDQGLDPKGAVVLPCADGQEFEDLYREHSRILKARISLPPPAPGLGVRLSTTPEDMVLTPDIVFPAEPCLCMHMLGLNGGATCLASNWPDPHPELRKDLVLEQEIRDALRIKGLDQIIAYAHFPCGIQRAIEATPAEMLNYLIGAKRRILRTFRDKNVLCFVQIRWPNGKRNTYFVSRVRWEEFVSRNPHVLSRPHIFSLDASLTIRAD